LLQTIFIVNDPQIQEDLASIAIGIAGKIKDIGALVPIARWALTNIFSEPYLHRNVIVREGFRAVVERASQYGLITREETIQCRPIPLPHIILLPLDKDALIGEREEVYPITHDLAWYVIKEAFEGFLEYPSELRKRLKDNDILQARMVLDRYRDAYKKPDLYGAQWALAAAIAYIRGLGFTRTDGNWNTEQSHGAKSKLFTFEEKYTWLAVHYIKGYLSDYIPRKNETESASFIQYYAQIVHVPNPAESIVNNTVRSGRWIIKEDLSHEIDFNGDLKTEIRNWINQEPQHQFEKWLQFEADDLGLLGGQDWLALYNDTALHNSNDTLFSRLEILAVLISKAALSPLINLLQSGKNLPNFITSLDSLHAVPKADVYSNPSDHVWMNWLDEAQTSQSFSNNISDAILYHTITEIPTIRTGKEEKTILPSKKIRKLLKIVTLNGNDLFGARGNRQGFLHKVKITDMEAQDIVIVNKDELLAAINKTDLTIVWFADLFKRKNMLNEHINDIPHQQRSRKYFIYLKDDKFQSFKFWDGHSTNIQ
jgi:hypothetical protein